MTSTAIRKPIVEVQSITKSYNGVKALDSVSLALHPGRIHGLVGHNGAGKSTLVKILSGVLQANSGTIVIEGRIHAFANPREALRSGVAVLHQELTLWPTLTVAENLWLESHPRADPRLIDPRRLRKRAVEALGAIAPAIRASTPVAHLTFADQQLVAIARILQLKPRVLVLDEPTSGLGPADVLRLGTVMRSLAAGGVSILFISHRLREVFDFCDEVTVLRDGRAVASMSTGSASPEDVVHAMAGSASASFIGEPRANAASAGRVVLTAHMLQAGRRQVMRKFELREAEVVGVLGLPGSGRETVVYSLVGDHAYGRWRRLKVGLSAGRAAHAVGIVPGDRHREGLFAPLSVHDNVAVGATHCTGPVRDLRAERTSTRALMARLRIRAADIRNAISTLSGGNQQKVLIARLLAAKSTVMVMDQPTNGVDVRSRAEIYRTIGELRSQGVAMVIGSTEAEELVEICTRIIVVSANQVVTDMVPPFDERHLMMAATGVLSPSASSSDVGGEDVD